MILTVCPNPCVDCTLELETLNVGRLNRVDNRIENLSGKAINTAIGVSRLGRESFATGFMFETGGRRFCHYLKTEGVGYEFVWNKGRLRVNYKIIDGKSMMTEINDRGEKVTESKQTEMLELVKRISAKAAVTVISGSLPTAVGDGYYGYLIKCVDPSSKAVVDCEGAKLKHALSNGVYLVKPNLYELESFTLENCRSYDDMLKGCGKLIDAGAQNVLLSLGKDGAILTDGKTNLYCKSENVAVNSTVGAGDSMLAAASVAIEDGGGYEEILRSAVAAGTASITTPGTNLFYKDKFEEIYERLEVKKI